MSPIEIDKKLRARLVFGAAAVEEDSLVYSSSSPETTTSILDTSTTTSCSDVTVRETALSMTFERNLSGPFDKIIGDEVLGVTEKENKPKEVCNVEDRVTVPAIKNDAKKRQPQQQQKQQQRQLILKQRSPLRRDLVKKTQDAINRASASVQQSIHAPQISRQMSSRYKNQLTSKVRQEWKQERAAATAFYQQAQKQRLEILRAQRDLSSQCSQARSRTRQDYRFQHLQAIEQESHFQSSVFRDHQQKLRQQQLQRRRMSAEAKAKMRENHRQGEERMKMSRIEEDCAVYDERHAASVALRETIQQNAQARRKSFAFRNGDARRIRQLFKEQERQLQLQEHESYQLKWQGEKDAEETLRRMQEERRQSLAARGEAFHQQRMDEIARVAQEKTREHHSMELKWEGDRDAQAYRKRLEQERRESLAFRNKEGSRQRKEALERASKELAEQHASIELKLAAERDADEYRKRLEQERRESLEGRNREGRRQREQQSQQRSTEMLAEHESFELKWAGERDAELYQKRLAEHRRASLAFRNKEGHRQRQEEAMQRAERLAAEHSSYELKWEGERDAESYRRDLQRQRRESLERRNKERSDHAKVMEELKELARESERESLVLKWSGEEDAKAYLEKIAEDRRKSLQLRGKQVQHHRQVEASEREAELRRAQEDELLRSGDHKDVEAYKSACASRDRASLQYRRKEAHVQRLEEEERRLQQQQIDESNFELESQARFDVEEYIQSCKQRRRLSLAFRAKEKRRHAEWSRHQAEQEREARSREVRDRLIDRRYEELARQQERARNAKDAIRHAGFSFNPFLGL